MSVVKTNSIKTATNKRTVLCIRQKVDIILELESGQKTTSVSKKYGLPSSTISTLWKNKAKILTAFKNDCSTKTKRLRKCVKNDVDDALLRWYKIQKNAGHPVNGPILKIQAEKFAKLLGHEHFSCNNGWITRFKNRNNITYTTKKGGNDCKTSTDEWINHVWPEIKKRFKEEDIYSLNEAALLYTLTQEMIPIFKNVPDEDNIILNNRLTILFCANMTGDDKRKLLIVGKLHCERNEELPVDYFVDNKAWLTPNAFKIYLKTWNNELQTKNKKIILLTHRIPSLVHADLKNLSNIDLFFTPAATSALQPTIKCFKTYYRHYLMLRLIEEQKQHTNKSVSLLDALYLIAESWNNIQPSFIANCFTKSLISTQFGNADDDSCYSEWLKLQNIPELEGIVDLNSFISIDDNLPTSGLPSEEEIIESMNKKESDEDASLSSDHNFSQNVLVMIKSGVNDASDAAVDVKVKQENGISLSSDSTVTHADACVALNTLYQYCGNKTVDDRVHDALSVIRQCLEDILE